MKLESFGEWSAICEIKARYCRLLDTKQWDAWADLFTEDLVFDTSEAAVAMVRGTLDAARTAHHVHVPEIAIAGDVAEVIWAMQEVTVRAHYLDSGRGGAAAGGSIIARSCSISTRSAR